VTAQKKTNNIQGNCEDKNKDELHLKFDLAKKKMKNDFLLGQLVMAATLVGRETRKHGVCIVIVTTLALGSRPKQRGCKVAGQEEARESKVKRPQGCGPRGNLGVTSHTPGNVRKSEGVNTHTPKTTPTLRDGVPVDSRNFKERFQGAKTQWFVALFISLESS
jgi:hypothetical protein